MVAEVAGVLPFLIGVAVIALVEKPSIFFLTVTV
jgi:hypothetical protein